MNTTETRGNMREKSKSSGSGSGTKQHEESSLLLLYQYNNVNQFRDIYLLRKFCVAGKTCCFTLGLVQCSHLKYIKQIQRELLGT